MTRGAKTRVVGETGPATEADKMAPLSTPADTGKAETHGGETAASVSSDHVTPDAAAVSSRKQSSSKKTPKRVGTINWNGGPDPIRIYEIFRARIVSEDQHINNRLTWLILIGASLVAVWASLSFDWVPVGASAKIFAGLVAGFGAAISILVGITIFAAINEISETKGRYKAFHENFYYSGGELPRITGNKVNHSLGHVAAGSLPILYIAVFGALLALSFGWLGLGDPDVSSVKTEAPAALQVETPPGARSVDLGGVSNGDRSIVGADDVPPGGSTGTVSILANESSGVVAPADPLQDAVESSH